MAAVTDYSGLITSQHRGGAKFVAAVELLCSASVDAQNLLGTLEGLYSIDMAIGSQLDTAGLWVGLPRTVFVPSLGTVTLPDDDYRTLLNAKILGNHYDGGMESLQRILGLLFPGTPIVLFAVDNQDMSMDVYITGGTPTPTQVALLKGGLLVPKPEGVRLRFVLVLGPLFGLDRQDATVAGLDFGAFATYL